MSCPTDPHPMADAWLAYVRREFISPFPPQYIVETIRAAFYAGWIAANGFRDRRVTEPPTPKRP